MNRSFYAFVVLFCSFYTSYSQKKFSVNIQFSENVINKNLRFFYDHGGNTFSELKPEFKQQNTTLRGEFHSKYATVIIRYRNGNSLGGNSFESKFWVTEKPAIIHFFGDKDSYQNILKSTEISSVKTHFDSIPNPLEFYKLTNAIALKTEGEEKFYKFCEKEYQDLWEFGKNLQKGVNDSLMHILIEKNKIIVNKKIEFIKTYKDSYYSFWVFRTELINHPDANPKELLSLFKVTFPSHLRNSFEGKVIVKRLSERITQKN